jgi:hypothetical protein
MKRNRNKTLWKRVLYEKQPYKDNYVAANFFDQLQFLNRENKTFDDDLIDNKYFFKRLQNCFYRNEAIINAFVNATVIAQQFTVVAIFLTVYKYSLLGSLILQKLSILNLVLLISGFFIHLVNGETLNFFDYLQSIVLFGICLRIVAPVLKTLTTSISSDTIHFLAISFSTIHLIFHDYTFIGNKTVKFSSTLSLNAAMFTSIVLTSRLNKNKMIVNSSYLFFLNTWIELKNICNLDNAFCNEKQRTVFLNVLNNFVIAGSFWVKNCKYFDLNTELYLKWIIKRNIFINHLCINQWNNEIVNYLQIKTNQNKQQTSFFKIVEN